MTRVTKTILLACLVLAGPSCVVVEAWELSSDFQFGVAGDGHLSEVLERIRQGNNLPASAAVSMTSTGVIELAATGLRAVGFPERVTDKDQWHLGSITKSMTATLAARLVEKGRITWDTRIGRAVRELDLEGKPSTWRFVAPLPCLPTLALDLSGPSIHMRRTDESVTPEGKKVGCGSWEDTNPMLVPSDWPVDRLQTPCPDFKLRNPASP